MSLTPDQWLDRLTYKMDQRATNLSLLRSYIDGNAPLPEGAENCRDAYKDFQRKARTNFGELVVEAVTERMVVSGFTVAPKEGEASGKDDDQCRSIWMRNRLQIGSSDVFRDMVGLSAGYMIVGQRADGKAVITCERPEQVITEEDAQNPNETIAGLKVYRDSANGYDVAFLHLPGMVFTYLRPFPTDATSTQLKLKSVRGGWEKVLDSDTGRFGQETGLKFVPVFPYLNRGGLGEFETHLDLLDRINWMILQRIVIVAMQAYRQRALKGDLPMVNEKEEPIDYGAMFKPSAGSIWQLPEGIELWESTPTDITSILAAVKDDIAHLAAVTRTPMNMLIPDGANQSAEGAAFAREGLVFKTSERVTRASAVLARAMEAALAIENDSDRIEGSVEVIWQPVERQSLTERANAAIQLSNILPFRTVMTDIMQFSADRVDEMEADRTKDALLSSLRAPMTPIAPVNANNPS
jgi:hypothetical protein